MRRSAPAEFDNKCAQGLKRRIDSDGRAVTVHIGAVGTPPPEEEEESIDVYGDSGGDSQEEDSACAVVLLDPNDELDYDEEIEHANDAREDEVEVHSPDSGRESLKSNSGVMMVPVAENSGEVVASASAPQQQIVDLYLPKLCDRLCQGKLLLTRMLDLGKSKPSGRYDRLSYPIGATRDNQRGEFVVCNSGGNSIHIYGEDGVLHDRFGCRYPSTSALSLERPSGIACVPARSMYAVKTLQEVVLVGVNDHQQIMRLGRNILRKPYGLKLFDEFELSVVDHVNPSSVLLVTYDVRSTSRSLSSLELQLPHFDRPCNGYHGYAIRYFDLRGDTIVLSDWRRSRVYLCDRYTGEFIREIGVPKGRGGQHDEPAGVQFDADGCVLVGQSTISNTPSIDLFSNNGARIGVVDDDYRYVSGKTGRMSSISLCKTAEGDNPLILVSQYVDAGCVSVYSAFPPPSELPRAGRGGRKGGAIID